MSRDAEAMENTVTEWPADRVERMRTADLVPYARNARTHTKEQVAELANSITEWGWTMPILVDEEGGIIAGHGRILAAEKLGLEEVPGMTAVGWTEAQKRAYVLADNQLALNAGWDYELAAAEIDDLKDFGFDVELLGFVDPHNLLDTPAGDMPDLPDGDRSPVQQMAFIVHDDQAEVVRAALKEALGMGPFGDTGNENRNGNALARICEGFLMQRKAGDGEG